MAWLSAIATYAEEAYAAAAEYMSAAYSSVAGAGAASSAHSLGGAAAAEIAEGSGSVWSGMASSIIQSLAMQAASSALSGTKSFGISERVAISPLEPRHIIFGKAWTAGRKMSKELTWDASCKKAEFLIAVADTQTTGIQSFTAYGATYNGIFVDGYPVTYGEGDDLHGHEIIRSLNPETGEKVKQFTAGGPWKFFYKYHDGSPSQVADQWLVDGVGSEFSGWRFKYPSRWDATAVAKGISYVRASAYFDSNIFTGFPEFNFYVNGVPLYNPAKDSTVGGSGSHRWGVPSTYESSCNPGVIAYNIARGIYVDGVFFYGCRYSADDLPLEFWLAAISACDEVVMDKAGTSPRYSCGFDWDVTRDAREALQVCARAMGGDIVEDRGQYLAFAGVAQVPVFTFTDDDMVRGGDHHYDPKLDLDNLRNRVTAKCLDVSQAFAQVDVAARYSDDDINADGGIELTDDLDLLCVQHVPTAQRVMKVAYQRHRCQATAVRTFKPHAMNARTGQWIAGTSRRWTGTKWFEIVTSDVDTETLWVTMSLREVPYNLGAWNAAVDELDKVAVSFPSALAADPLLATGISATPLSELGSDGSASSGFAVTFDPVDDPTAQSIFVRWRLSESDPVHYVESTDLSSGVVAIRGLAGKTTYQYSVLISGIIGRTDAWSEWYSVTTLTAQQAGLNDYVGESIREVYDVIDRLVQSMNEQSLSQIDAKRIFKAYVIQLNAKLNDATAQGYLAITVEVSEEETAATVWAGAKVSKGDIASEATFGIHAEIVLEDGVYVRHSWAVVRAGSFCVQNNDGDNTFIFDTSTGLVSGTGLLVNGATQFSSVTISPQPGVSSGLVEPPDKITLQNDKKTALLESPISVPAGKTSTLVMLSGTFKATTGSTTIATSGFDVAGGGNAGSHTIFMRRFSVVNDASSFCIPFVISSGQTIMPWLKTSGQNIDAMGISAIVFSQR